jgi:hypothetical protein
LEGEIKRDGQREVLDSWGVVTLFGENMLRHSLDYNWEKTPAFLLFDVYSHDEDEFLPLDAARSVCGTLGLEFVPVLDIVSNPSEFDPTEYGESLPASQFRDGLAEGVVIKNYETQCFAKLVAEENEEVRYDRWGYAQTHAEDYTELLVARFVTNERIEKQLRKLVVENGPDSLGMELLEDLKKRVYNDIFDEHMDEIVRPKLRHDLDGNGQVLDFGKLHELTMKRCRGRLRSVVDNRQMMEEIDYDLDDAEYLDLMAIGTEAEANSQN